MIDIEARQNELPKQKDFNFTVSLSAEQYLMIKDLAKAQNISMHKMMRQIVVTYLHNIPQI
jgi:hypothetical protein